MKFVRCLKAGQEILGVLTADESCVVALSSVLGRSFASMTDFICESGPEDIERLRAATKIASRAEAIPAQNLCVCAPIPRPIHDILCVGVNYFDHLKESQKGDVRTTPKPVFFAKRALTILGPGGVLQSRLDLDDQLDYEVELAVIIGKKGRDIRPEDAREYIFGYSVFNDFSSRQLQHQHGQWFKGKSLDSHAAMGPCILHGDDMAFPVEADLTSRVNGEIRQQANTRLLMTGIPELIAFVSAGMTLEPGDILATGTPAGVGMGFTPPRFLARGDEVTCEIAGIGKLTNTIA